MRKTGTKPSTTQPNVSAGKMVANLVCDHFDPEAVINELVHSTTKFRGKCDILFAGLCAWMVSTQLESQLDQRHQFVSSAMIRRMAAGLEGERKLTGQPKSVYHGLKALLSDETLQPLFRYMFEPFGGLMGILNACSANEYKALAAKYSADIDSVIKIMQIFHHHETWRRENACILHMSLEQACSLLEESEAHRHGNDAATYRNRWKRHYPAAALIYAADQVRFGDQTLLSAAKRNVISSYRSQVVRDWLRLARAIDSEILANCGLSGAQRQRQLAFPRLKKVPLPPLLLEANVQAWLAAKYKGANVPFLTFQLKKRGKIPVLVPAPA